MIALNFEGARVSQEYGGDTWLSLKVKDPEKARSLCDKVNSSGKVFTAEVKEFREKRSLRANRYLWELLGQMGAVLQKDKEDLYLEYIRKYGQFRDFTLEPGTVETFCVAWHALGTGWPTEKVDYTQDGSMIIVRAYYGSSQYSTKRMSMLLDAVVADAKDLGIDTETPEEQAKMLALFEEGRAKG